jgi:hypothetical protein
MKLDWKSFAIGLGVAGTVAVVAHSAKAADLSGSCCSDLEERIAELEATAARKGNRKVTVNISGVVHKSLLMQDWDDTDVTTKWNGTVVPWASGTIPTGGKSQDIIDGATDPSFVSVTGTAAFATDWKAGYVLEIGLGGFDEGGTNELYTQRSFVFVDGPVGKLSLGHASQATDDLDRISTANTIVAARPLSVRPLIGPQTGEVLDLYDGTRGDLVRYDSPVFGGFYVSASWASGNDAGDVWDIAARYAGEFSQFRFAGGVGYRHGIIVNGGGASGVIPEDALDLDVITAVGSVMHMPSGIFVTANYGRIDGDLVTLLGVDSDAWAVTAGIEQKLFSLGKTTAYAEYGDGSVDVDLSPIFAPPVAAGIGLDVQYWGGGLVQNIESAATDLYASVRFYDVGAGFSATDGVGTLSVDLDTKSTIFTAGARVRF